MSICSCLVVVHWTASSLATSQLLFPTQMLPWFARVPPPVLLKKAETVDDLQGGLARLLKARFIKPA
jgi:hypothetical protein